MRLYCVFHHILSYMSVLCYPICGNHPAIRIKRIRLPVNLADCIVPVGVPTQQIPPAPVLAHPASKILARHPAVRSLDPRCSADKTLPDRLHLLILTVSLARPAGAVRMMSEDAVMLKPCAPLLMSLRSAAPASLSALTVATSILGQVFLNASKVP